jgi:hypothetical protein
MDDLNLLPPPDVTQPPADQATIVVFHPFKLEHDGIPVLVTYRPDGRPVRASCRRPPA